MFASKTLREHVFRGLLAVAALGGFGAMASSHPVLAFAMLPVAVVALRGCPMCWTIGLVQTIIATVRRSAKKPLGVNPTRASRSA